MFSISIIAVGTMKRGALLDHLKTLQKRMQWQISITECKNDNVLINKIDTAKPLILLDEKGENITSRGMAKLFQTHMNTGNNHVQIVIGGADGLPAILKESPINRLRSENRLGLICWFGLW